MSYQSNRGYDPRHLVSRVDHTPPGHVEFSAREAKSYSLCKAIAMRVDGSWERKGGLEKEASDAIAARLDKPSKGLYLPMNIRTSVTGNVVGTASLGGNAVETSLVGFIDILRNRMKTRALGATLMTGLKGNLAIPRQTAENDVTWVGENPSTGKALTALTLDQVTLSPKIAMGGTAFSRLLLTMGTPDADNLAIKDLAAATAIGIDAAAINGTGSDNQPRGLLNTSGTGSVAIGTNGGNLTWAKCVGFETEVSVANADANVMGFLTTPGVRGSAKQVLRNTTSGSHYLWEDGQLAGYRAEVSQQVPSNLTKGTSTTICHAAIFGDWSQLLIGEWGGALDILIDPYKYADQGMVAVYSYAMIDVAVRQPAGFAVCEDILV